MAFTFCAGCAFYQRTGISACYSALKTFAIINATRRQDGCAFACSAACRRHHQRYFLLTLWVRCLRAGRKPCYLP